MKIQLKKKDSREMISSFLKVMNLFLETRITESEIILLTEFVLLDDEKYRYFRFAPQCKTKVLKSLKSIGVNYTKQNLNNKLYSLLEKKIVRRDEDGVMYYAKELEKMFEFIKADDNLPKKIVIELDVLKPIEEIAKGEENSNQQIVEDIDTEDFERNVVVRTSD